MVPVTGEKNKNLTFSLNFLSPFHLASRIGSVFGRRIATKRSSASTYGSASKTQKLSANQISRYFSYEITKNNFSSK